MNVQEIEQTLSLHDREISEIRSTLVEVTTKLNRVSDRLDQVSDRLDRVSDRLDRVSEKLNQVADQQDINTQQIADNAEGITGLRILMEEYFRRSSGA